MRGRGVCAEDYGSPSVGTPSRAALDALEGDGWHDVILDESFPPETASVARARAALRVLLVDLPLATIDVVLLVVSELATNAVLHARTWFTVTARRTATLLRVEVSDESTALPKSVRPQESSIGGWGLQIVERFASRWGSERTGRGKTVWAEFDC